LKEKQNHEKIFLEIIKTALKNSQQKNYATIYYVILILLLYFKATHHNLPADA